ncbi:MAG: fasciclin domain-containing protein [Bacteroidia bacterium]|nr:fasciclin domain-containing protein [Bacteroidia bacterium]
MRPRSLIGMTIIVLVIACQASAEKKARQKRIDESLKQIRIRESLKQVQEEQIRHFNTPQQLEVTIQNKLKTGIYFLRFLHKVPELQKRLTQSEDSYTLFIPSDSAFTLFLQKYQLDTTNAKYIQKVLENHIVPAHLSLLDLMSSSQVVALSQKKLPIEIKNKKIYINNACILNSDIPYHSGILHSIDQVLY